MMRSPKSGMTVNKRRLDNPALSHIDVHHGLASIGFTDSTHFSGVLADAAELFIEQPSRSGSTVFLTS